MRRVEQRLVLERLTHAMKVGRSLSFPLPAFMARALRVTPDTRFYVYVSGGALVYSLSPPQADCVRVKARVQARLKGRFYYVLTIPRRYAADLGIRAGDSLHLRLVGGRLRVRKVSARTY